MIENAILFLLQDLVNVFVVVEGRINLSSFLSFVLNDQSLRGLGNISYEYAEQLYYAWHCWGNQYESPFQLRLPLQNWLC